MKFTGLQDSYPFQSDEIVERFTDWSQELVQIIESRVFSGTFVKLIDKLSTFEGEVVSRLTDEQLDEQLTICSQYKFTLSQLATEVDIYRNRIKDYFEVWLSEKSSEVKKNLLEGQKEEVEHGIRTKGSYAQVTAQDVRNELIVVYKRDYLLWKSFLEKLDKSYRFVHNLVSDLEHRSFVLMNLSKRR